LTFLAGRFDAAEELVERFGAVADPDARLYAEIQGFVLMVVREQVTLELSPVEHETGRPAEYAYRAGYSWVLAIAGRADEARAQIELIAADGFSRLSDDMNRLAALAELAQALALLDEPGPAARVLKLLEPYAGRNIVNARELGMPRLAARAEALLPGGSVAGSPT
jgi:hypothetical protein